MRRRYDYGDGESVLDKGVYKDQRLGILFSGPGFYGEPSWDSSSERKSISVLIRTVRKTPSPPPSTLRLLIYTFEWSLGHRILVLDLRLAPRLIHGRVDPTCSKR